MLFRIGLISMAEALAGKTFGKAGEYTRVTGGRQHASRDLRRSGDAREPCGSDLNRE